MQKRYDKPKEKLINNDMEDSMRYKNNRLVTALNYEAGTYTTDGILLPGESDDIFYIEHGTTSSSDLMALSLQETKWLIKSLQNLVDEIEK